MDGRRCPPAVPASGSQSAARSRRSGAGFACSRPIDGDDALGSAGGTGPDLCERQHNSLGLRWKLPPEEFREERVYYGVEPLLDEPVPILL